MGLLTFPEGHIESQAPGLVPQLQAQNLRISNPGRVWWLQLYNTGFGPSDR